MVLIPIHMRQQFPDLIRLEQLEQPNAIIPDRCMEAKLHGAIDKIIDQKVLSDIEQIDGERWDTANEL